MSDEKEFKYSVSMKYGPANNSVLVTARGDNMFTTVEEALAMREAGLEGLLTKPVEQPAQTGPTPDDQRVITYPVTQPAAPPPSLPALVEGGIGTGRPGEDSRGHLPGDKPEEKLWEIEIEPDPRKADMVSVKFFPELGNGSRGNYPFTRRKQNVEYWVEFFAGVELEYFDDVAGKSIGFIANEKTFSMPGVFAPYAPSNIVAIASSRQSEKKNGKGGNYFLDPFTVRKLEA